MDTAMKTGRVAIITGGAGGIGQAIARRLVAEGCLVALLDIDETAGRAAAREIESSEPDTARFFRVDAASAPSIVKAVASVVSAFSRIDILVNSAGITRSTPLEEISSDEWDLVQAINLRAPFLFSQQAAPMMRAQRWGRIINLSSIAAIAGGGFVGTAHYAASKAGLIALTKAAARSMGKDGITVNAIAPGPIRTAMSARWIPTMEEEVAAGIPVGRIGEPDDIAAAVSYLASDHAGFVNGHTLIIDGGVTIGTTRHIV